MFLALAGCNQPLERTCELEIECLEDEACVDGICEPIDADAGPPDGG